jgi:hypothetical protein
MWLRRVYFVHSACPFSVFLVGLYQCLVGDIENEARFFCPAKARFNETPGGANQ